MRHLLLMVIKMYWRLIPAKSRPCCLFKESCSQYVYRITVSYGLWEGLKALNYRYLRCRPGYWGILDPNDELHFFLCNGDEVETKELRENVIQQCMNSSIQLNINHIP